MPRPWPHRIGRRIDCNESTGQRLGSPSEWAKVLCRHKSRHLTFMFGQRSIQRIHITGGPGSGKTWLASRLARALDVPCYHLDDKLGGCNDRRRERGCSERQCIMRETFVTLVSAQ